MRRASPPRRSSRQSRNQSRRPRQPSSIVSIGSYHNKGAKHTTGAGMSVVGTASESESESSSSESDSSSEELDSGVGSLTTFLDFFSCENVRRDPKWTTRKEKLNSRQGRPWKPSSPSSRRLPWRRRQGVLPWMRTWMLLPFCLLDDWVCVECKGRG